MNNHNLLITFFIILIVAIQITVFLFAVRKILTYKRIFKNLDSFHIKQIAIPDHLINYVKSDEVDDIIKEFEKQSIEQEITEDEEYAEVEMVDTETDNLS